MNRILIFTLLMLAGCGVLPDRAGIVVQTEDGDPIEDATVSYSWSKGGDPWTGKGVKRYTKETTSDSSGVAMIVSTGRVTFLRVSHKGFYSSGLAIKRKSSKVTTITLRRTISPTPFLGKQAFVALRDSGGAVGYDLVKGDLLPPYGSGQIADFEIRWERPERNHAQDRFDAFDFVAPNSGDGFVALHIPYSDGREPVSAFHTLYEAPGAGYVPSLKEAAIETSMGPRDVYVYYVRIRTTEPDGPLYGKIISGPTYTFHDDATAFKFVYMINTAGNRNMEPDFKNSETPRLGHLEYPLENSTGLINR